MSRKNYALLLAAAIAIAMQSLFVVLNIEGDRSLAYWLTCIVVLVLNSIVLSVFEHQGWTRLSVYCLSGFAIGVFTGFIILLFAGKTSIESLHYIGVFHPNFGMLLVESWCLFTGIFGLTFSSLFWLLRRMQKPVINNTASPS